MFVNSMDNMFVSLLRKPLHEAEPEAIGSPPTEDLPTSSKPERQTRSYKVTGLSDQLDELEVLLHWIQFCGEIEHDGNATIEVNGDGPARLKVQRVVGKGETMKMHSRQPQPGGSDPELKVSIESISEERADRHDEEAMCRYMEIKDEVEQDAVDSFFGHKKGVWHYSWPLCSASRVVKIWTDYAKTGVVRDEKGIDEIANLMATNVARLEFSTALSGHCTYDWRRNWEDFEDSPKFTDQQIEQFTDGVCDPPAGSQYHGDWRISDYGLGPMRSLAIELLAAETAEQKLQLIDRMFNVTHARGDLSGLFVEGGISTLNKLAGKRPPDAEDVEDMEKVAKPLLIANPPEGWQQKVIGWLRKHEGYEEGAVYIVKDVRKALAAFGWLDDEELNAEEQALVADQKDREDAERTDQQPFLPRMKKRLTVADSIDKLVEVGTEVSTRSTLTLTLAADWPDWRIGSWLTREGWAERGCYLIFSQSIEVDGALSTLIQLEGPPDVIADLQSQYGGSIVSEARCG